MNPEPRPRHGRPPIIQACLAVGLLAGLAGCGGDVDSNARKLMVHTSLPGKIHMAWVGPESKLIAQGRVDMSLTVAADDGTGIGLWVIRARGRGAEPARGTVLLIHGLWNGRTRLFDAAERLAQLGFDVVLPDLRGHGASGGEFVTFGGRETGELKQVMDRLAVEKLIAKPVYAVGFSMGGGIAVQYAAADPDCRGVVAFAPVGDARRIMRRYMAFTNPLVGEDDAQAAIDRAGEIAGFDVDRASAVAAARKITCPLVVVHGRLDAVVPNAHGREIYDAAAGPKRLEIVPWAGHNAVLFGRAEWIADQVDQMARGEFAPEPTPK